MKRRNAPAHRPAHPFGDGFEFAMRHAGQGRFGRWWNRQSFFPVGGDEAEAIFSGPEPRRGE